MSQYTAMASRALALIRRKGAPVTFPDVEVTPAAHDPATDTFSGGTSVDVVGRAVEIPGNPDRWASLGLVLVNPVTLIVAAKGLTVTPRPGTRFEWSGLGYTTRDVLSVSPDGEPIVWTLVGST